MARPGTDFVSWIRFRLGLAQVVAAGGRAREVDHVRAGLVDLAISRRRTRRIVHEVNVERALGRANALRQRRRAVERSERGVTLQDAMQG